MEYFELNNLKNESREDSSSVFTQITLFTIWKLSKNDPLTRTCYPIFLN